MSDMEEVEKFAQLEFAGVVEYGFLQPKIDSGIHYATINWFYDTVSFEVALDWRELLVNTFLVRLEDGTLPNGYYISNNKKCRIHLTDVILEHKWPADQNAIKDLQLFYKSIKNYDARGKETMKREIQLQRKIFFNVVKYVISDHKNIF